MHTSRDTSRAFQQMAANYEAIVDGELRRFWGWRYHDFVDVLLEELPARPWQRLLDVATGTAVIPRKLLKRQVPIDSLYGLDLTMGMLRQGQPQAGEFHLTNANALSMPYADDSFDALICCLATHHMGNKAMLAEMKRVLRPGGLLLLADVCAARHWRWFFYRQFIQLFTLLYFCLAESWTRARAEMASFPNILTVDEWQGALQGFGFHQIKLRKLKRKYFWIPHPVVIKAIKS